MSWPKRTFLLAPEGSDGAKVSSRGESTRGPQGPNTKQQQEDRQRLRNRSINKNMLVPKRVRVLASC